MMAGPSLADRPALARFRGRFPGLADTVHLASCSQGALSVELSAALAELQHHLLQDGNPWGRWVPQVDGVRTEFARLVNARPEEIALVSCASEGAFHVAATRDWSARPRIVTTDTEFPSVAHVWLAQRPRGADVWHVADRDGVVRAQDYADAIDERTGLVSVPLVSYRNGARLPVHDVTRAAHEAGAKVFVDGFQGAGVLPVDVRALDCDYFVTGSLKYLLGLPGLAFLYAREGVPDDLPPQLTGWFGRRDPFAFDPRSLDFADSARRYETGTPAIPSVYAARAGLRVLGELPPQAIEARVTELVGMAHERLVAAGERLTSPVDPALRGPMVAVVDEAPDRLGSFLAERRIATSPRGRVVRLAFHAYNDESDVDAACAAIAEYRRLDPCRR